LTLAAIDMLACRTPRRAATHCNALQHTATRCNTLQLNLAVIILLAILIILAILIMSAIVLSHRSTAPQCNTL